MCKSHLQSWIEKSEGWRDAAFVGIDKLLVLNDWLAIEGLSFSCGMRQCLKD